jgi:hypothetical protein
MTITWEEVFLQQRVNAGLNELLYRVKSPPQFTTRQLDVLAAFLNVAHMSTVVANQLQLTIVDFRKYRANREDMVTSVLAAVGPGSSAAVMSVVGLTMRSGSLVRVIAYFLAKMCIMLMTKMTYVGVCNGCQVESHT